MLENLLPHPWFFTAFLFSRLLRTDCFPLCYFLREDNVRANSSFPAWPWKPQRANLVVDRLPLDKLSLGKPTLVLPISRFYRVACWSKAAGGRELSVSRRWMGQASKNMLSKKWILSGRLGGSLDWVSSCLFWLGLWSPGHGMQPGVGLCTQQGDYLRLFPSVAAAPRHPPCLGTQVNSVSDG